jgi:7-carboxy-7-deazaguanine synthase (Cx14CxxC type)
MTNYKIKEIFYTLQGEGAQAGRPAVFCRFSGCNLWSGREEDRAKAICQFCDTDFWGMDGENGGKYTADELADQVISLWPYAKQHNEHLEQRPGKPYVVCTGGEPLLQLDEALIQAFHQRGLEVAVETNGTIAAPPGLDWICMSPKANTELLIRSGHELKLVYPQLGAEPILYEDLDFNHFYLQPMDGPDGLHHTRLTLQYCLAHPQWKLSLQTHKLLGIP